MAAIKAHSAASSSSESFSKKMTGSLGYSLDRKWSPLTVINAIQVRLEYCFLAVQGARSKSEKDFIDLAPQRFLRAKHHHSDQLLRYSATPLRVSPCLYVGHERPSQSRQGRHRYA